MLHNPDSIRGKRTRTEPVHHKLRLRVHHWPSAKRQHIHKPEILGASKFAREWFRFHLAYNLSGNTAGARDKPVGVGVILLKEIGGLQDLDQSAIRPSWSIPEFLIELHGIHECREARDRGFIRH